MCMKVCWLNSVIWVWAFLLSNQAPWKTQSVEYKVFLSWHPLWKDGCGRQNKRSTAPHTPFSLWSCYLVIISHPGWRGIRHRGGQTFIRDILQALDLRNLFIIWRRSWEPAEKVLRLSFTTRSCSATSANWADSSVNQTLYPERGSATGIHSSTRLLSS